MQAGKSEESASLQYPVPMHNTERPLTPQMFALNLNLNFPVLKSELMYTEGLINMHKRPGMQEIESILDNPDEMAEMSLANKEAALDAEAEQVRIPCTGA